ncbi:MAG: DNA polymerase III subunit beta [Pyrinomonadaceae bacterium]
MEFTIKQSTLKDELNYIAGVVERKATIPVLSNILIESIGENEIRIVGTDLDCTMRCDVEADIKETGAICIQARKLFDIVRALPSTADLHFKREDNQWVTLKAGRSRFRLAGVSKEQFPEIPQFKATNLKLPAETFAYFIQNTAFAITAEQSRFTLSGAKFVVGDGKALMVATDGHRLAYIEREAAADAGSIDTLIPRKALLELSKLARDSRSGEISFGEDQNHLYFQTADGRLLITRKLTGQFPNYEMVMPKETKNTVTFELDEMRDAVRRISLMADERQRSIRITVREGEVEINARSSEEGEGVETIPADYKGEETTLGFNWQYLMEFLNNVGALESSGLSVQSSASNSDEEADAANQTRSSEPGTQNSAAAAAPAKEPPAPKRISFEFNDANAATQMRIAGETVYNYKYIVMPLRI